ncbi:MAG TPA: extracellular solute-binding protein [bacterium]|nr:extracellular solute-binding protein [bacterium]
MRGRVTVLALLGVLVLMTQAGYAPVPILAASSQTVHLTAWTIGPDEPSYYRKDNLVSAADALNKQLAAEGSGTRVTLDATFATGGGQTWGAYKQRFVLAAQSGKAPDIVATGNEDIAAWAAAGYVIPLDGYVKQYKQFADVIPTLWNATKFNGKIYAIPQDVEARPFYFNMPLLAKLGWSQDKIAGLPKAIEAGQFTLTDLLQTAKAAQDKGLVLKGYGWWIRPINGPDYYMYYEAFGGKLTDASGKLLLDSAALGREYGFFHDAVFTYKVTPKDIIGTDWNTWHEAVIGKQVLFTQCGTWCWAQWITQYKMPAEELWKTYGFALVPSGSKGGRPVTLSHPIVYMISKSSAHPDLAARLLALATTPQLNARHAVTSGHLAILADEGQVPEYAQDTFAKDTIYMLRYTTFLPADKLFGAYDQAIWEGLSAVIAGQMTPGQAVQEVAQELRTDLGDHVVIR